MRTWFFVWLVTTSISLSYCHTNDGAGVISIERDSIDLGAIALRDTTRISYRLSNTGDAVLKIKSVGTSCGCSRAYLSDSAIHPRRSAELNVSFTPTDTGRFKKYIIIETNAPAVYSTLVFTGFAKPD